MRILIIAHKVPYPPLGGATLRNFNLLKECSKNNEIHLITFVQEPYLRDPDKLQSSIDVLKKYCKVVKVFRIPTDKNKLGWYLLLFSNLFSLTPYSCWRFWSYGMVKTIKEHLKKYSYDLIEIGTIALVKYAKLAPHLPKLLIHHNIESQLLYRRSKTEKGFLARTYIAFQTYKLIRLERKACEVFDYHTTVSELDKQTLQENCPNINVAVIDNGVDTDFFQPQNLSSEENTLVFTGGMHWYPNADAMLFFAREIWPILKKKIPNIKINVIGLAPPEELVEYSKNDPHLNVLGFVDDVRPYVAKAAVYVVPIRVGGGTRLKILDAMAQGKAIVSHSIGAEGLHVTNGKDILIANEPKQFANEVIKLIRNEKLRKKIEVSARETAENLYSWKKIAPKLQKVYDALGTSFKKDHS